MTKDIHQRFVAIAGDISPQFADDIRAVGPVDFPDRADTPFGEYLCRVIVGQQLSVKAAATIWGRVVAAAAAAGATIPDFFTAWNSDAVRAAGVSGAKTKTLGEIRQAGLEGRLDVTELKAMDHAARAAGLSEIWGVGPWTTDMVSMFYFREPDIWPGGDLGVKNAIGRYTGGDAAECAARFTPHRTHLALYLWRILDRTP